MATNLLEMIESYITPEVVQRASTFIGEDPTNTQKALGAAVPSILAGLINRFSSTSNGSQLLGILDDRSQNFTGMLSNPANFFTGSQTMMTRAQNILRTIFGDRLNSVTNTIASDSGVRSSSAESLLAFAAPLAMGAIAKVKSSEGLDRRGLANLLTSQRDWIIRSAPAGLASALGLSSLSNLGSRVADTARRTVETYTPTPVHRRGLPGWLWAAAAVAVLLGLLGYLGGHRTHVREQAESARQVAADLPNGRRLNLSPGSANYDVAKFLADKNAGAPRTFTFDNLNFDTATTNLTGQSQQTVSNLAEILKAYPNATVALTGHTDNTGTPESNKQLSMARAEAVKGLLVQDGIDGSRITTQGAGQNKPIVSNDTEEGRAKNRRIELEVTKK